MNSEKGKKKEEKKEERRKLPNPLTFNVSSYSWVIARIFESAGANQ